MGCLANTLYHYRARSTDAAGNLALSDDVTLTTLPYPPATPTPTSPTGTIATTTPSFQWNAVAGVDLYLLRVTNSANVVTDVWPTPASLGCASGTGACVSTTTTAPPDGASSWAILAWNSGGYSQWSATISFTVAP